MGRLRAARRAAFTMVEMLVVIAVTAILLGLLFFPIFQGFAITKRVQEQAIAQDAARLGVEKISRELAQAVFVFDNTHTPVVIPLPATRAIPFNGGSTNRPPVLFTKIDAILPDRVANGIEPVDPTTGKPLSGGDIRFPLAPGTRVVRYFLGLLRNVDRPGAPAEYRNPYEFPIEDTEFNPLVLYRAEFDPTDPNLIASNNPVAAGGFHDPNFFYNQASAPNGRSFAYNWSRIASPVISGPRLDMLAWRRDGARDIMPDIPFRTLATFTPAAIAGDTATPGFLTAGNAEAPGAVPTLYTTQAGQWTTPFSITFFRSTSASGNDGQIKFTFEMEPQGGNPLNTRLRITTTGGSGTLTTAPGEIFPLLSPSTGKIFVKTPRLAFAVDALRGRIETGFPPLAGTSAGVPLFNNGGGPTPMSASFYPDTNTGELVPTMYRVNTRDTRAGVSVNVNQGLLALDAFDTGTLRYELDNGVAVGPVPAPGAAGTYHSPLRIFGNVTGAGTVGPFGGIMIAPGTESVLGPELTISATSRDLVPYRRASVISAPDPVTKSAATLSPGVWGQRTGQLNYEFDQLTRDHMALFRFDAGDQLALGGGLFGADTALSPGLPAKATTDPPTITEKEIRLSYLWQNNYARNAAGLAVNADDTISRNGNFAPEADVVKVDYSTRSLLNIAVGARVYSASAPNPVTIQFTDRVRVGNATR